MGTPDPHPHLTLFFAIWAAVGPLVGLGFGTWLQARGQHQQWRRDNVRQECRELLGQLSVNLFAFIDWHRSVSSDRVGPQAAIFAKQYSDAVLDLHRNFGSRILIAKEIRKARIQERWKTALDSYSKTPNRLDDEYESIVEDIVNIGLKAE
jgi:hypothetical protein